MSSFVNPAWLPFPVSEAVTAGDATRDDLESGQAWEQLLESMRRMGEVVLADDQPDGAVDRASGFRHLLVLLGVGIDDFMEENLNFFLGFYRPETPNAFLPPFDGTAMRAAAENRPVVGSWSLGPDEALVIEVTPSEGIYWSYSLGNAWWETIDYANHQSNLNGHQTVVDDDGRVRVVVAHRDPGVANWLDTADHFQGPVILRCVRTESAPVPTTRVVPFDGIDEHPPLGTVCLSPVACRLSPVACRLSPVACRSEADALTEAAGRVPRRRGDVGFTVQKVLRQAGLETRAFYRHFASKEALILDVFGASTRAARSGPHSILAPWSSTSGTANGAAPLSSAIRSGWPRGSTTWCGGRSCISGRASAPTAAGSRWSGSASGR